MIKHAYLPNILAARGNRTLENAFAVGSGIILMSLLAQVSIHLPWTPVPITGQTFGVAFISLLFGRKLAVASIGTYLMLGAAGLPIYSGLSAGAWGPTAGYLIGMFFASIAMGTLADRGWTRSMFSTWLAAVIGSLITFSFGLLILRWFVPAGSVFAMGLIPFLPGDLIKTFTVTILASRTGRA